MTQHQFRYTLPGMSVKDHPIGRPRQVAASTTPRPQNTSQPSTPNGDDGSNMKTPTKDSFGGMVGQRPLPCVSLLDTIDAMRPTSSYSAESDSLASGATSESMDVRMEDADGVDNSDNESATSDVTRMSKKKKSQKFFCTDFPPCQLSFTRSEHLARHIRYGQFSWLQYYLF